MDADRFDALVRSLPFAASRRIALSAACSGQDDFGPECTVDDDCPLGRFCLNVKDSLVCSAPCAG